jgi:hypothetical protein
MAKREYVERGIAIIPKGTTKIDEYAFKNCTWLECVVIPLGVTEIGKCAFENCTSLTTVILPFSVERIDVNAFDGCSALTTIYVPADRYVHYNTHFSHLRGKIAPDGNLQWREACRRVLAASVDPMHVMEIVKKIIEKGYRIDLSGTPRGGVDSVMKKGIIEGWIENPEKSYYKLVGTPVTPIVGGTVSRVAPVVEEPCDLYDPSDSNYKKISDFIELSDLSKLEREELELLDLIVNFRLPLEMGEVCFADIIDKLNLKVEIVEKKDPRPQAIDRAILEKKLDKLRGKIARLERDIANGDTLNDQDYSLLERMKSVVNKAGNLPSTSDETVESTYRLLGEFIPPKKRGDNPKVVIYYKNIRDSYGEKSCYVMPAVFVHEMFHAWNYFKAGRKSRSVLAIDEPMVEFASLYFLKELEAFTSSESHLLHDKVLDVYWEGEKLVMNKQLSIGDVAAYGFGYYLFNELGERKGDSREWIETYSKKSASIKGSNKFVKQVENALIPIYPFMSEAEVMEWFEKIIFARKTTSVIVRKSTATKVGQDVSLRDLVLACIEMIGRKDFKADELYAFAPIFKVCVPQCKNLEDALKWQLDELVKEGILEARPHDCYREK